MHLFESPKEVKLTLASSSDYDEMEQFLGRTVKLFGCQYVLRSVGGEREVYGPSDNYAIFTLAKDKELVDKPYEFALPSNR